MLLALDLVFLRDVLAARIPDVIAPTAVIAAAIAGHYLSQRAMKNVAMIGMIVIVAAITVQVARGSESDLDTARASCSYRPDHTPAARSIGEHHSQPRRQRH